jgi:hypothetical protein
VNLIRRAFLYVRLTIFVVLVGVVIAYLIMGAIRTWVIFDTLVLR